MRGLEESPELFEKQNWGRKRGREKIKSWKLAS